MVSEFLIFLMHQMAQTSRQTSGQTNGHGNSMTELATWGRFSENPVHGSSTNNSTCVTRACFRSTNIKLVMVATLIVYRPPANSTTMHNKLDRRDILISKSLEYFKPFFLVRAFSYC